ncbi:MAG: alkaline phosphatase family protein [Flavobacteriales bacterium]|nr:alkaline phosphatase family protein [Flavobacteriales bacterium]
MLALLLVAASACAQEPTWQAPPKLVVGVVVDQMRTDYIYRYWDNFGEGGFKRLIREGSFQRDARYNYAPTHTGPGHASIYTGTTPRDHGIVANDMFFRADGRWVNCVQDDNVMGVGGNGPKSKRSPVNLYASTIADELERRFDGRSRTIGVSMKDRSAILPIGRTGDAAFWFFEEAAGQFGTSTWYTDSLPAWLKAFNARDRANEHLSKMWEPLLPRERYHEVLPDDNPYEELLPGEVKAMLPLDVPKAFAASGGNMELMKLIPGSLVITTDLALAALDGEGMGTDAITDLLAISYSATDEIGHATGPRSIEVEDMYLRLDRELERLLTELDRRIGKDGYTLFLTADHGAVDVPAWLASEKASAGYVESTALVNAVETALTERYGAGPWVRKRVKEQFFLSDSLLAARRVDRAEAQRIAAEALRMVPGIAEAYTATELRGADLSNDRAAMVQRGFFQERSGDVCFILRPSHLTAWPGMPRMGTEHGSPWSYDTQVPVIFFGRGVAKGEVLRPTAITDVAATVCALVGMAPPDASIGQVVPEVLAR